MPDSKGTSENAGDALECGGMRQRHPSLSLGCARAGGVRLLFLLLQREDFLGSGSAIRVMLMHRVFELRVIFLHMLVVLLLVQLVLVFR